MSSRKRALNARKTSRMRQRKKTISATVLFFVLVSAILASLLFIPFFNITSVSCNGTSVLSEEAIIDASGVALGVNIFRIPVHKIEENIEKALPYVSDVTVHRSFPSSVRLEVTERIPVAYVQNGASYLVIDSEGVALENANDLTVRGTLPLVPDLKLDSEKQVELGKRIEVQDHYRLNEVLSCIELIAQKPNLNGRVTKLLVNDLLQYELMVENRILAIIPVDSDLDYQLDFMLAALAQQSPTIEGEIDLTIEGKAAFRPKTQEVVKVPEQGGEEDESSSDSTEETSQEEPVADVQE